MNNDVEQFGRSRDKSVPVIFLKDYIDDPEIEVGEYTYYHDMFSDPRDFIKNNILYHFPGAGDHIKIGKFCSIACGAKFLCPIAHHDKNSLAYYPFPIFDDWGIGMDMLDWDRRRETIVGNDVWLGFESVIMPGVHIGDGAAVGTRSVVTKDVPPYTVVAGSPAKIIRKRFDDNIIEALLKLKWWDLPMDELKEIAPYLIQGKLELVLERKLVNDTAKKILQLLGQA